MKNTSLYNRIGCMKLEDLEGFIAKHGWNCQHCGNHEFEIEEYADTGWCAVSATPYVTYKKKKERYSECGTGSPAYTILCSKCFATTKYDAARIADAIETKSNDWPAPKIVEAS
jgi:hypothetical protein